MLDVYFTLCVGLIISLQNTASGGKFWSFKNVAKDSVFETWYSIVSDVNVTSITECSYHCLRLQYCVGIYYHRKNCSMVAYSWESNGSNIQPDDFTNALFIVDGSQKSYIYNRHLAFSYKYSNKSFGWNDAVSYCQQDNAQLLTIKSPEKNTFITNLMNTSMYLGLSDIDIEGDWRWVDGSAMTYQNFGPTQPNDHDSFAPEGDPGADCASMKKSVWMDVHCGRNKTFFCEIVDAYP